MYMYHDVQSYIDCCGRLTTNRAASSFWNDSILAGGRPAEPDSSHVTAALHIVVQTAQNIHT